MREQFRNVFIAANGWEGAAIEPLPADASRRRYFRLTRGGKTRLLMDMPRHAEEKFDEFVLLADHLRRAGLSAPEIFALDAANGFALIEDFGDGTFTQLLREGHDAKELYFLAIDAIAALQQHAKIPSGIGTYSQDILVNEFLRLVDWYYPLWHGARASVSLREEFSALVGNILDQLPILPDVPVLLDFHVDNLMLLPNRKGAARCGLLDFQDAMAGNPTYDVVSLLEDARRDVPPDLVAACWQRYISQMPDWDAADLAKAYDILGLQRHGRLVGQFIRLWVRDNKPRYLEFMPRVTAQFMVKLQSPIALPLRAWCTLHLPELGKPLPALDVAELRKMMLG